MEQPSKIEKALPLIFIAVAVIVGWQIGYWQSSWTVKERLTGYQLVPAPVNSNTISGTIERIEGDTVYVRTSYSNPLENQKTVAVAVTAATVIEKLEPKDQKVLNEELRNFTKNAKTSPTAPPMPPEPFVRKEIKASDLVAGQSVSVIAEEASANASRVTAVSMLVSIPPPETAALLLPE